MVFTRAFTAITSAALVVILTRALGPEAKGAYTLILSSTYLVSFGLTLGINQANLYLAGDRKLQSSLLSNSVLFLVSISLFLSSSIFFAAEQISELLSLEKHVDAVRLASVCAPLMLMYPFVKDFLISQVNYTRANLIEIVLKVVMLIFGLNLVYLLNYGVVGAIFSSMSSYIFALVIGVTTIFRSIQPSIQALDRNLWFKTISFGAKSHVGTFFQHLTYKLDIFTLNYFSDASTVGIYTVAIGICELLTHLPTAVGTILFQRLSNSENAFSVSRTCFVSRMTIFAMIATSCFLGAVSYLLIPKVFGNSFEAARNPLLILLPGYIFLGTHNVLILASMGLGHPKYMGQIGFISLAISIPLYLMLIPSYGMLGAALASSITYSMCCAYSVERYHRITGATYFDILIPTLNDVKIIFRAISKTFVFDKTQQIPSKF